MGDAAMSVKKQNRNLENHGKEAYYLCRFYMLLAFLLFASYFIILCFSHLTYMRTPLLAALLLSSSILLLLSSSPAIRESFF